MSRVGAEFSRALCKRRRSSEHEQTVEQELAHADRGAQSPQAQSAAAQKDADENREGEWSDDSPRSGQFTTTGEVRQHRNERCEGGSDDTPEGACRS